MAEPFNVEQFRQQMSGQGMPPAPQQGQAAPSAAMPPPAPQAYQPAQMQPRPYQPHPQQMPQPQMQTQMPPQMSQQAYAPQGHMPTQGQPQPWAQNAQGGQMPPAYATPPQHQQPQFTPPPSQMADLEAQDEAPVKSSRFKLKRAKKEKPAKAVKEAGVGTVHKTKTSPAIIFMFGMATGIVAFLVGNMMMANLLDDKTAQSFRDIERRNAQVQQPVLPGQAKLAEATPPPARAEEVE